MTGYIGILRVSENGMPALADNVSVLYRRIDPRDMDAMVEAWCDGEEIPRERYLARCGDGWVCLDNTSGNCYVEDFDNENLAIAWVIGLCDSEGAFY